MQRLSNRRLVLDTCAKDCARCGIVIKPDVESVGNVLPKDFGSIGHGGPRCAQYRALAALGVGAILPILAPLMAANARRPLIDCVSTQFGIFKWDRDAAVMLQVNVAFMHTACKYGGRKASQVPPLSLAQARANGFSLALHDYGADDHWGPAARALAAAAADPSGGRMQLLAAAMVALGTAASRPARPASTPLVRFPVMVPSALAKPPFPVLRPPPPEAVLIALRAMRSRPDASAAHALAAAALREMSGLTRTVAAASVRLQALPEAVVATSLSAAVFGDALLSAVAAALASAQRVARCNLHGEKQTPSLGSYKLLPDAVAVAMDCVHNILGILVTQGFLVPTDLARKWQARRARRATRRARRHRPCV